MMQCSGKNCKLSSKYKIVYDCGPDHDQNLILCSYHYGLDEVFQRNIKKLTELNEN